MQITILKPGVLSTIQDLGRYRHLADAVPVSGAMDTLSARVANKCVGNDDDAALMEFTYADAAFRAETGLLIAYAGGGSILWAGDKYLPPNRPIFIPAATIVSLVNNPVGARTYLAIAGGWDVPEVLASKSTFLTAGFGGLDGRALKAGDVLDSGRQLQIIAQKLLDQLNGDAVNYADWSIPEQIMLPAIRKTIRVVPANEFTWFDSQS